MVSDLALITNDTGYLRAVAKSKLNLVSFQSNYHKYNLQVDIFDLWQKSVTLLFQIRYWFNLTPVLIMITKCIHGKNLTNLSYIMVQWCWKMHRNRWKLKLSPSNRRYSGRGGCIFCFRHLCTFSIHLECVLLWKSFMDSGLAI